MIPNVVEEFGRLATQLGQAHGINEECKEIAEHQDSLDDENVNSMFETAKEFKVKRNEFFNVLENILSDLVEEPAAEMQSKEVVSSGRKIGVNQPMNADEATMEVDSSEKRLPLKKRSIFSSGSDNSSDSEENVQRAKKSRKLRSNSIDAKSKQPEPTKAKVLVPRRTSGFMSKRVSQRRKTVGDQDELEKLRDKKTTKNTDRNMYYAKELYKTLCLFCNENHRFLVSHYTKKHSDFEVFISRPSPKMVNRIKLQKLDEFKYDSETKKITGICYFCEEVKSFHKNGWEGHLRTHTGEQTYFCEGCNTERSTKLKRHNCESVFKNIYELDGNNVDDSIDHETTASSTSKREYPLRCYICKLCNYTQIKEVKVKSHLRNEHDSKVEDLSTEYESYVLVPNIKE